MTAPIHIGEDELPPRPPGEDELPYDDGEAMESARHRAQMHLLIELAEHHLRDIPGVVVGGNMAIYFSERQFKRNDFRAPDFFVAKDMTIRPRKSFVVWEAERTPDLVVELLSERTEAEDRGPKMQAYARSLHVLEYYLYDPATGALEGYRLRGESHEYRPMTQRPGGGYRSEVLGADLVVVPGDDHGEPAPWLRLLDWEGRLVPTGAERAEAERERADAAETETQRLLALLRAAGIDPSSR